MSKAINSKGRVTRRGKRKWAFIVALCVFQLGLFAVMPYLAASDSQGKSVPINVVEDDAAPPAIDPAASAPKSTAWQSAASAEVGGNADLSVQAVLSAKSRAVIAGSIDAKIKKLPFKNGDLFKKGDVLVAYDCSIDWARLKEAEARQRMTQIQLEASEKLFALESAAEVELKMAKESNEQNIAIVNQIKGRLAMCSIRAPFDGRVTNRMASEHEFAQAGRVIMDIASREKLQAELLIPSIWLQWLNVGTPLQIYINETDRDYAATITNVHGEVDPVSRTVQVVAEISSYSEELLPGMSGRAFFSHEFAVMGDQKGFLGLVVDVQESLKNEEN